jgi:hypothetical protein
MSDLEEMIRQDLGAVFRRAEDEWLNTFLYGSGSGELRGIISVAPAPRAPRAITLADVNHLRDLFRGGKS